MAIKSLWMRVGATFLVTEDELERIRKCADCTMQYREQCKILYDCLLEGRVTLGGETFQPDPTEIQSEERPWRYPLFDCDLDSTVDGQAMVLKLVKKSDVANSHAQRIAELEGFINACLDCSSADETVDFLVNNYDKVMDDDSSLPESRNPWAEDPEFPVSDWQYEVRNNDTRLGYHEWVEHQKEAKP